MPNRLTAALGAVLAFAATLAVVADTAAAHEQTTTKRYCSYDPFAGKQCWTETVPVAHRHPPPNQTCPAGTTGTPPNCLPVPSDNSGTRTQPPTTTTAPPPTTTTAPPPTKCPAGQTGTPPNCKTPKCADGQTGTPPNCQPEKDDDKKTDKPDDGKAEDPDSTENPCEPWPTCNQSSDPKPETVTTCVAPGRKPGHKHGDHGCHPRTPGHTHGESGGGEGSSGGGTTGSAYSFANALGKVLNWFDSNKDTLADPPQALTDAVKSHATRDKAKAAARFGLDFIENNLRLFGGLTIAEQKALSRAFLDAPPEAQVIITTAACGVVTLLSGAAGTACGGVLSMAIVRDEDVRPWLRPFSEILLPEDDDSGSGDGQDTGGGTDSTDSTDGQGDTKGTRSNRPLLTSTTTPPTSTTTPPKVTKDQVDEARKKWWNGEMDYYDFLDLNNRYKCDSGQIKCSG